MPPRKCSRENCPTQNIAKELTVSCHRCRCQMHLLCYGVNRKPEEIFLIDNIVMFCDKCISDVSEEPSPKRKGTAPNFVQRTLDSNMMLTTPLGTESPSNKPSTKPTTQKLIESLQTELKTNTETISALKTTVESMHGTIMKQKETVRDANGINSDNIETIKTALNETHSLIESIKKQSYASVAKGSFKNQKRSEETPRTSRTTRVSAPNVTKAPVLSGTSKKVIGKPLSPVQSAPKIQRKMQDKAIWISRLHRDTGVEDIQSYVRDELGIEAVDQLDVRKLVKKDRDISTYSFVSFRIGCPLNLFETLMDTTKWPEKCNIREFKIEMKNTSGGVKLNEKSPSKNVTTPHENQTPYQSLPIMETISV